MTTDIFKLFKKSIEQVTVKKTERGTFNEATVYSQQVDAIIKRRTGMQEATQESEDRETQTTVHFRASDAQYIEDGNFVLIDGRWRVIERQNDGKHFTQGSSKFIRAWLGDQIENEGTDPVWS